MGQDDSEAGTKRSQKPIALIPSGEARGSGFDTLDKALVVWQDQNWPTRDGDLARSLDARKIPNPNPNPHRRVDIIVAPWRTVGCAVLGWSGEPTFERDLRAYSRRCKGWKFDSSGVRDDRSGQWIQLEGPEGVDGGMVDAEKTVFRGLGLEYVEPEDRCTG